MILRSHLKILEDWRDEKGRKPLVLRGARQVGKTALVRELGKSFKNYIEINFDETPDKASYFKKGPVEDAITLIEAELGKKVIPGETLLFLDEIQAAPEALAMLRYFYEKKGELHVIAAGSLLEFLLADHNFSMPVGRIEYCFIPPLTFEEFLGGIGEKSMVDYINKYELKNEIPLGLHQKLIKFLYTYFLVGGMPEAVVKWLQTKDFNAVQKVHASILQTYEDDFTKYMKRLPIESIRTVFKKTPALVGQKIRYTNLDRDITPANLNKAIRSLASARVLTQVYHSHCNGIPLGAEINDKKFKALFLDIGLQCNTLALKLNELHQEEDLMLVHQGACTEQYVGQELLSHQKSWLKPEIFYWHREQRASNAELDYVINHNSKVIPIEVKSGKTGSLRSLHSFMATKQYRLGVRFNSDTPSVSKVDTSINALGKAEYTLLSLPLYLTGQLHRLIESEIK